MPPAENPSPVSGPTGHRLARRLFSTGWSTILLLAVLLLHGLLPGRWLPTLGILFPFLSRGESFALGSFFHYPQHIGYPFGAPVVFGLPAVYLHAALIRLFGLGGGDAYIVMCWVILGAGFFGAKALFRRCGVSPALAALGAAIYLGSIFIVGHRGYTALMFGFALIPLSIWSDFTLNTACRASNRRRIAWIAAIYLGGRVLLLFLDGYSFVISSLFSGCLLASAFADRERLSTWGRRGAYTAAVVLANAAAYVAYTRYVPAAKSFATMPPDFFRAQSADLATLVIPINEPTLLSSWLHWSASFSGQQFYGDGSNAFQNYLGFSLLLGLGGLVWAWRRQRVCLPVAAAGFICLLLSLGPSLKVLDIRPAAAGAGSTRPTYVMPAEAATLNLGTTSLYTQTPAVKSMRSVYRWIVGLKVVVLLLSLLALSALIERRHFLLAALGACILIADSIPPPARLFANYRANRLAYEGFYADVIPALRASIPPRSKLLFVSTENDFLAGVIATALESYTYNVAGDKNIVMARASWPREVRLIRKRRDILAMAGKLHDRGELDYLIFPHFSLRWASYGWPPSAAQIAALRDSAAALLAGPHRPLRVETTPFATIVSFPASDEKPPAGPMR